MILHDFEAIPTVGVHSLEAALAFYRDRLGLIEIGRPSANVVSLKAGSTRINLYVTHQAGRSPTTTITWEVGSRFDATVQTLRAAGVWFDRYQPAQSADDTALRFASFKDPDGNQLCLVNR
jgi:catechol 2,3-dioxygenase-like lactoylglutathione lyase family enzyme